MNTSTTTLNNTSTTNTKANTMNTTTFLSACIARIQDNKTWNHDQLKAALGVVYKKNSIDPAYKQEIGSEISSKLAAMKDMLNQNGSRFCSVDAVLDIFTATAEEPVAQATRYVSVFTDGSCKDKIGGWGVHIKLRDSKVSKQLQGHMPVATNNTAELKAMVEGIKAIDFSKEGFVIKFITDSRYVLQTILNEEYYQENPTKLKANPVEVMELIQTLKDKGVTLDSHPRGILAAGNLRSGQVIVTANGGTVEFKWVKGHNGLTGNEEADRLATQGRLQGPSEDSEVIVPEQVQEAVVELSEALNTDYVIITHAPFQGTPSSHISKATANQREGCVSEDFHVINTEFYSDARAEKRGIKLLDLEALSKPSKSDIRTAKKIAIMLNDFDFAYQNSDDSRTWARNASKQRGIDQELRFASTFCLDLVNLYKIHVLEVLPEFCGPVVSLPNTKEEALKYFG